MMRPTPHQNYPRAGYSLEGKPPTPVAAHNLKKIQLWKNSSSKVGEVIFRKLLNLQNCPYNLVLLSFEMLFCLS